MSYMEVIAVLQLLTGAQLELLVNAHRRYLCFAGVHNVNEECSQLAEKDRLTYPQWYSHDGQISDIAASGFMSAVSGIHQDVCLAWIELDIGLTHNSRYKIKPL